MSHLHTLLAVLLAAAAAGTPGVGAQRAPDRRAPSASGSGSIAATVVTAATGAPIRFATVSLLSLDSAGAWTATTDTAGRFRFDALPAGRYTVTVTKAGFVTATFGAPRRAAPLDLADGERLDRGRLELVRGGVVVGRVLDANGEPVADVHVSAYRADYVEPGVRRLSATRTFDTNDLGEFRLYGLRPGTYYVGANLRNAPAAEGADPSRTVASGQGIATTFFPGTPLASDAQPVVVNAGQDTPGVDIQLLIVPLARISGVVVDSRGRPRADAVVMLNPARADAALVPGGAHLVEVDASGRFTIADVAPGDYRIDVVSKARMEAVANTGAVPPAGGWEEFASVPLTVNGENMPALTVQTGRGSRMAGHLQVEGPPLPPDVLARVRVSVQPAAQTAGVSGALMGASTSVRADGTFEVNGLGGLRLVRVYGLPPGFALKRVAAGGVDVTDDGLDLSQDVGDAEIVVTAAPAKVTGTVTDSAGTPVLKYHVIVFSADAARWTALLNRFVTSASPDANGMFTVTALPAGDYLAAVVDDLEPGEWADPRNLERLRASATRFSLADGETRALRLVRASR